jgi:hypothetical protein
VSKDSDTKSAPYSTITIGFNIDELGKLRFQMSKDSDTKSAPYPIIVVFLCSTSAGNAILLSATFSAFPKHL